MKQDNARTFKQRATLSLAVGIASIMIVIPSSLHSSSRYYSADKTLDGAASSAHHNTRTVSWGSQWSRYSRMFWFAASLSEDGSHDEKEWLMHTWHAKAQVLLVDFAAENDLNTTIESLHLDLLWYSLVMTRSCSPTHCFGQHHIGHGESPSRVLTKAHSWRISTIGSRSRLCCHHVF